MYVLDGIFFLVMMEKIYRHSSISKAMFGSRDGVSPMDMVHLILAVVDSFCCYSFNLRFLECPDFFRSLFFGITVITLAAL